MGAAKCFGDGRKPCCTDRAKRDALKQLLAQIKCDCKFEEPAALIGAAGGTASFYRLIEEGTDGGLGHECLGKDLSCAPDELEFYEAAKHLKGTPGWHLLDYMIGYRGALGGFKVRWSDGEDLRQLDLLVMENLVLECSRPRLLDLKIGDRTSAVSWKGKSVIHSWRQDVLDSVTNSCMEGLRLEGFMNPPVWLDSEDPLLDMGSMASIFKKNAKKAKRFALQRMAIEDVMSAFGDLRCAIAEDGGNNVGDYLDSANQHLTPGEYSELIILAVVRALSRIFTACGELPVPQKWIGSSVAVVAEAGKLPDRPQNSGITAIPPGWVDKLVQVRLFDWGRSELNTPENHEALSMAEQLDRRLFWAAYQAAIGNALVESARVYWNSFCVGKWTSIRVAVYDYDSQSDNDLLGVADIELPDEAEPLESAEYTLFDDNEEAFYGQDKRRSQVRVSARFASYPQPSRLRGCWLVRIESASHLRSADLGSLMASGSSDPFALVSMLEDPESSKAAGRVASRTMGGRTKVVQKTLNPVWDEELEFPVAIEPRAEDDAAAGPEAEKPGAGDAGECRAGAAALAEALPAADVSHRLRALTKHEDPDDVAFLPKCGRASSRHSS